MAGCFVISQERGAIKTEVMGKVSYISEEGLQKLKEELDRLKSVERPALSRQIAEARDKGDLTENAEYAAAKEAQGMLEMRIARLEDALSGIRIIDESKIDTSTVQIMNTVTIRNRANSAVMKYTIVSETEADLKAGKISVSSPIARGLLGRKKGDTVDIQVPSGKVSFEIVEISI